MLSPSRTSIFPFALSSSGSRWWRRQTEQILPTPLEWLSSSSRRWHIRLVQRRTWVAATGTTMANTGSSYLIGNCERQVSTSFNQFQPVLTSFNQFQSQQSVGALLLVMIRSSVVFDDCIERSTVSVPAIGYVFRKPIKNLALLCLLTLTWPFDIHLEW